MADNLEFDNSHNEIFDFGDVDKYTLESEIGLHETYLATIEAFLEIETHKIKERFANQDHPLAEQVEGEYLMRITEYENLLRKSFIVNIYTFLEDRLVSECHRLAKSDNILLTLQDIAGQDGIDKARTYFIKVLKINFPTTGWVEIKNIQNLRNCIVHNHGRLSGIRDEKRRNQLRVYIAQKSGISLILNGKEIYVEKGYCEEVCQTVKEFLSLLLFDRK